MPTYYLYVGKDLTDVENLQEDKSKLRSGHWYEVIDTLYSPDQLIAKAKPYYDFIRLAVEKDAVTVADDIYLVRAILEFLKIDYMTEKI